MGRVVQDGDNDATRHIQENSYKTLKRRCFLDCKKDKKTSLQLCRRGACWVRLGRIRHKLPIDNMGEQTALEIALVFNTGRTMLPLIMKESQVLKEVLKNVEMLLSLTVLGLTGLSCTVLPRVPLWLQPDSGWAVFLILSPPGLGRLNSQGLERLGPCL